MGPKTALLISVMLYYSAYDDNGRETCHGFAGLSKKHSHLSSDNGCRGDRVVMVTRETAPNSSADNHCFAPA